MDKNYKIIIYIISTLYIKNQIIPLMKILNNNFVIV